MKTSVGSPRPWLMALAFFTAACSSLPDCPVPGQPVAALPPAEIDATLFLIGDTGDPEPKGEPVLRSLRAALKKAEEGTEQERVAAVFLGDNIYPAGLEEPTHSRHAQSAARLDAQLEVFADLEADGEPARPVGIFVPGNHDWHHDRSSGEARVRRQASYLVTNSAGLVRMRPADACPGPAVVDVGERLRIVAVDTQWWLRKGPKPEGAGSGCDAPSAAVVAELVEKTLAEKGERRAVVVAHHPFVSGGPHGGHSFLRRLGLVPQDLPHRRYQEMKAALTGAFAAHPPLVYAAGHDHSLQLLTGDGFPYQAVSGGGCAAVTTGVGALKETLFCRKGTGFLRLDFARDGRVRLAAVDASGSEVFATFLR